MNLVEAKQLVEKAEPLLAGAPFVLIHTFERNKRKLILGITERLRRRCRKGRVWKSREMLAAIKNAGYGFDPDHACSSGGRDGIFVLTRTHQPRNKMMRKIFNQFIDKPDSEAGAIARALGVPLPSLQPVRLVSHHMRLLGLLRDTGDEATLILVDYDNTR